MLLASILMPGIDLPGRRNHCSWILGALAGQMLLRLPECMAESSLVYKALLHVLLAAMLPSLA